MTPTIISLANLKGGVAKTTSSLYLSRFLPGKKLLVDLDPQTDLTEDLKINEEDIENTVVLLFEDTDCNINEAIIKINDEIDFIPSSISLSLSLVGYERNIDWHSVLREHFEDLEQYDWIILDCPPALTVNVTNALVASDFVIVPFDSDRRALKASTYIEEYLIQVKNKVPVKLLWTRFDGSTKIINDWCLNELANNKKLPSIFDTRIPKAVAVTNANVMPDPLHDSTSKAALAYKKVANEIEAWVK